MIAMIQRYGFVSKTFSIFLVAKHTKFSKTHGLITIPFFNYNPKLNLLLRLANKLFQSYRRRYELRALIHP